MTVAPLPRSYFPSVPALDEVAPREEGAEVRLGIHDASRIEWSVSVPLPEGRPLRYVIDVEVDIPANAFARHAPWDQFQCFTRLDGAAERVRPGEPVSLDALRRGAVALAQRLARANEGFARHCRLAPTLATDASEDLEKTLSIWIEGAIAMAREARKRVVTAAAEEAAEVTRERTLVDEYISVRLLDFLAGAERALSSLALLRGAGSSARLREAAIAVEELVADGLEKELAYRSSQGFICVEPAAEGTTKRNSPSQEERYLDRASRLKKHFQEVLFLEPEIFAVAEKLQHLVAMVAAIVASTWAFVWQIALMRRAPTAGTQVGSGIALLAVIAGLVYAGKDRIKELGRKWIAGNVHRYYAQRVARYRAPARRLANRDVVVRARESFDQTTSHHPDPLNPECGAALTSTLVHYLHRGTVLPQAALTASGVRRIKHVFRYDLSPLFARLDDAVKPVPVLDRAPRRVRFVDAPRCYRVPFRVKVTCDGHMTTEDATLVLNKRGLDRLEREGDTEAEIPSVPELAPEVA